jgi:RNA polymerase sigma-70 factor, ECF subfamily
VQPSVAERRLMERNPPFPRPSSYSKLTDLDLVTRARSGDRRALDALVERHAPRVNRLAGQLLEDFEEARDAAQESLVKLCTRLRQFRGDAQFATWLHRLVVNTCRDRMAWQRVRRTEPLPLDETAAADDGDLARIALLGDLRRDVADALAKLSRDQRIVVVLRDSFGLSYEEIARIARMPVGTAKCYVHRARVRLRARLEEQAAG